MITVPEAHVFDPAHPLPVARRGPQLWHPRRPALRSLVRIFLSSCVLGIWPADLASGGIAQGEPLDCPASFQHVE